MTQDVPQGFAAAAADFEAMARRFWGVWADSMRQAPTAAAPSPYSMPGFGGVPGMGAAAGMGVPGMGLPGGGASGPGIAGFGMPGIGVPGAAAGAFQDPFAWWAQQVRGPAGAQDAAGRFDALARHWYVQMQQLVAQFAGRDNSAADVAEAWRQLLQAGGGNPFAQLFAMAQRQPGSMGPEAWMHQAAPWLQALRGQAHDWLRMPAFGVAREHQERWQLLASAQIALQEKLEAYGALMATVLEDALQRFERKLAEREAPGLGIDAPRALFDLWIDAAEDAYAPVAMGPEFRRVYAELVDAQMRVRQCVQREVEQVCALFDMPTRTELDGAHRKIVELERQVRRLRDAVTRRPVAGVDAAGVQRERGRAGTDRVAPQAAEPRAEEADVGAATGTRSAVRAPPARKSATKRTSRASTQKTTPAKSAKAPARAIGSRDADDARAADEAAAATTRATSRSRAESGQRRKAPGGARTRASATAAKAADVPRGSRIAGQDGGAEVAPATRAAKKKTAAPRHRKAQPAKRPSVQRARKAAPKAAAPARTARKAASPPTRRGQAGLFSAAEAMPTAPQPLKTGKGKR